MLVAMTVGACDLYFGGDDEPELEPEAPRGVCRPLDPQVARAEYSACEYVYEGAYRGGGAKPLFCEPGGDPGHAFKTWTRVNAYGETWQIVCRCPDDGGGCPDEKLGRLP
jgi:hypothetical protein